MDNGRRYFSAEEEVQALRAELYRLTIEKQEILKRHDISSAWKLSSTIHVKCPATTTVNPASRNIFLAGPINSDNWQKTVLDEVEGHSLLVFNPRKDEWKTGKVEEQTAWEITNMEQSNVAVFWFSWNHPNIESTLLQLGKASSNKEILFIGIHSSNKQKKTIHQFVKMYLPHIQVANTLEKLTKQVLYWLLNGTLQPVRSNSNTVSSSGSSSGSNYSGSSGSTTSSISVNKVVQSVRSTWKAKGKWAEDAASIYNARPT